MAFQYFPDSRLQLLVGDLVKAGLATAETRRLLLQGVNPVFAADLPALGAPRPQLLADVAALNRVPRLADGSVPLEQWLRTAVFLTDALEEGKTFRAALDDVQTMASGVPVPDVTGGAAGAHTADPGKLPESKEKIVHQNDMVPYGFLACGSAAGASVARLKVARFEGGAQLLSNGKPVIYLGTGWMIGPDLLITNHHVVNARNGGEAPADEDDFRLQGTGTVVQFDYDGLNAAGTSTTVAEVVAADRTLDYALLRLPEGSGRPALRLNPQKVVVGPGAYLPVNIIQHPGGEPKQVAIRNNLVTAAEGHDLRYFTDTMPGSSGSPVFNDAWSVIALHRGSVSVEGVKYQGRDTAWVNVGTAIGAILEHVELHAPAARARIGA